MYCYGNFKSTRESCSSCELAEYCKTAKNPRLLTDRMSSYNDQLAVSRSKLTPRTYQKEGGKGVKKFYTYNDLMELITFMLGLDSLTIEYLAMYLGNPTVTFQQMADRKGVTKQAVHKYLKKQCNRIPELNELLKIGDRKKRRIRQSTFIEEVGRIQRRHNIYRNSIFIRTPLCWGELIGGERESVFNSSNRLKGSRLWQAE